MRTEYRLDELFDLQMGKTPARNNPEYWDSEDYKWISIADLSKCGKYIIDTKEYLSEKAVQESGISQIPENTVIMSFKLSIGKTAITPEPMYSNEAIMSFRDKHITELLPDYLYYMFSGRDWEAGTNKAVMGKTLNKATLSATRIKVHSIDEQRDIVAVLDKVKSVLDSREEELRKLDELIKARFVEMFGDIITNPYGLEESAVKERCKMTQGVQIPMSEQLSEYQDGYYRYLYIRDLKYDDDNWIYVRDCFDEKKLTSSDLVVVNTGNTAGEIYRGKKGILSNNLFKVSFDTKELSTTYLFYYFRSEAFQNMLWSEMKEGTQPHLGHKIFGSKKLVIPPMEFQNQFGAFVKQVDKSKVAIQKSLKETQLLFDSLMQQYFGKNN